MKQKQLFLLGLVLAFAGTAQAADVLRVQDVEVVPGESVTLNIELDNETTNLMGWQCDIVLPDGLSLDLKANGKPAATLGDRFATTEHTISSSRLASGAYRFIATSMDGEAIPGNGGTLFTVTLLADAELQRLEALPNTLAGTVANIEFNTQDNRKVTLGDVTFTVTIAEPVQPQCATPTIAYDRGELVFACETEDVTFVSEVKVADAKSSEGERLTLMPTYEISVVAKKEGYADSDVATATIQWREGRPLFNGFSSVTVDERTVSDVNGDGEVGIGDIVAITNVMAGK